MPRWSPFDPNADRTLVRGLNEGDKATLAALYDLYAERLYDYCLSLVCESRVAADIVHDCLIDASRRAPRMRDRVHLRAWLYGAARRRCLQRGRSGGLYWAWTDRPAGTDDRIAAGDSMAADVPAAGEAAPREARADDGTTGPPPVDAGPPEADAEDAKDGEAGQGETAEVEGPVEDRGVADDGTGRRTEDGRQDGTEDGPDARLPLEEQRELVEATFARLCFLEQEALLLALRHGLTGSSLAAALGLSGRRATSRVSRARNRAEVALRTELGALSRRRDGEARSERRALDAAEAGQELAAHTARESGAPPHEAGHGSGNQSGDKSPASGPRQPVIAAAAKVRATAAAGAPVTAAAAGVPGEPLTLTELLTMAPAPVPPAALRRRVIHTGTDPELAGYRADIAGRGGNLTAQGLPRQPDVPSPFARRWLVAASGTAGAMAAAIAALLVIGPELPGPDIYWPSGPLHKPSTSPVPPKRTARGSGAQAASSSRTPRPIVVVPVPSGHPTKPKPPPTSKPVPLPRPGWLGIGPTSIQLATGQRTAYIRLSARHAPITWNAVPSTSKISISDEQGTIPEGRSASLLIELQRGLVELQGTATITFTNAGNNPQTVRVSWEGSIFT